MSRIDELIAELCPDGVRFIQTAQLFDLRNGYTPSKSNTSFWSDGTIPWFRMEDIRANGGVLDRALQQIPEVAVKGGKLFPANSILVATSATIGEHALVTVPHLSNQRFTSLSIKSEYADQIDIKFIYYYGFVLDQWCRNNTTTSSFASVDMTRFKRFRFPIPPLEVQREIVRVLDQFTQLEAELEAELEARRRQYVYYREVLLKSSDDAGVREATLGDIIRLNFGTRITKKDNVGTVYPVYGGGGESFRTDAFNRQDEWVISRFAMSANCVRRVVGKFWMLDSGFTFDVTDEFVDKDFLGQLLLSMQPTIFATSTQSAQKNINVDGFKRLRVKVPSLETQRRVAFALTSFDGIVNDLSSGLPAELNARRKQYEFYRDRLLTFKELVS